MQRDVDLLSVPLYSCPPKVHQDPDFVKTSIKTVLMEQGYEGDAWAAAGRIEEKARRACKR